MSKTYIPVALRRQVYERAKGCCEYCLIPDTATFTSHEIDHIIAEKHGGRTKSENLALSCAACNKYKGTDLASIDPETEEIVALILRAGTHLVFFCWESFFLQRASSILNQVPPHSSEVV
jgi:hypothetical protein